MSLNVVKLADKDDMDRNKALDAALSQIERAFGKGSIMAQAGGPDASRAKDALAAIEHAIGAGAKAAE